MATTTQTQVAKLNVIVTAVREWQRGAITQPEMLRRADVDAAGEAKLAGIGRTTPEAEVARVAAEVVGL